MIPAEEAFRRKKGALEAKWPDRSSGLIEPLCFPPLTPRFTFDEKVQVFTIGSCFARNIEQYFYRLGIPVPAFHFSVPRHERKAADNRSNGVLNKYTPHALLNEVRFALAPNARAADDFLIEEDPGVWHDSQLVGMLPTNREKALARREEVRQLFRRMIDCKLVIITLGLIESWFDSQTGLYISWPPEELALKNKGRFFFHRLTIDEARKALFEALELILASDPHKKILLTVSPVPLARTFANDNIISANLYSKSVLRVIAAEAKEAFANVDYIPIYEMATLSDRQFVWGEDLRHVRDDFVGKIVSYVFRAYFPRLAVEQSAHALYAEAMIVLRDDPFEAYRILRGIERDFVDDAGFLTDIAQAALLVEDFPAARSYAQGAVDKGGETRQRLMMLGRAALQVGKNEEALFALRRCLALAPNNFKQWKNVIRLLQRAELFREALAETEAWISRLGPKTPQEEREAAQRIHQRLTERVRKLDASTKFLTPLFAWLWPHKGDRRKPVG